MPKKAGPSLLCEWMVGTTIRSALGPPPKPPKPKPKKRDVIKLHVTTDDESGEDTLTITYPRSEKLSPKKETQAAVSESEPESEPEPEVVEVLKKVRFEKEAVPRKSAMKKKTSVTFCEEEETKPDSGTDATSTSASSGEATPEASSSNASSGAETSSAGETSSDESSKAAKVKPAKSPRKKKAEKPVQSSESEADSDPHPTCECKECMSGRKKQKQETICEKKKCKKNDKKAVTKKKNDPETESEPETSASEAESSAEEKPTPSKKSKERKKGKKKAEISETEGETSESAKETEAESEEQQKKSPEKKKVEKKADTPKAEDAKKDADKKEEEAEKGNNTEEAKKAEESKPEKSPTGKGKEKEADEANKPTTTAEAATSPTPQAKDSGQNVHYPQGYYSHSRPPNLIAPIRTEVMQTERVVETKDDPLPNAYYDALHNVVRVYHGSVYGQNGHQNFAPRENTTGYSHPPGMSHPMQNPYYPYYNNVMPIPPPLPLMPPHGYEHGPITPGMPVPGWNGMVPPPPGFPGYNYQGGPLPMPAGWYEQQQNKQGTKGAYSMFNGMGNTPDSKGSKDKSREPDNNVMPEVMKVRKNPKYSFNYIDPHTKLTSRSQTHTIRRDNPPSVIWEATVPFQTARRLLTLGTPTARGTAAVRNEVAKTRPPTGIRLHGGVSEHGQTAVTTAQPGVMPPLAIRTTTRVAVINGVPAAIHGTRRTITTGGITLGAINGEQVAITEDGTGLETIKIRKEAGMPAITQTILAVLHGAMAQQTTNSRQTIIPATTVTDKDKIQVRASPILRQRVIMSRPPT